MRALTRTLVVLILVLAASARAGSPAREIVVQLSSSAVAPDKLQAGALRAGALPAAVQARFGALALHATRAFVEQLGASQQALPEIYNFHPERIMLLEAPDSALATSALAALADDGLVDWAERNVPRWLTGTIQAAPMTTGSYLTSTLDTLANDPYLRAGSQYGLWNIGPSGQFGGIFRADVHAIEAWRVSVGSNDIKLAYADTGIDPNQPELGGLMPDGSPRITDALNVTDDSNTTTIDLYGHGTPVAGVMAARTNDGSHFSSNSGVAGVCGGDGAGNAGCRIVPIKIAAGHSGEATSYDIARAFIHAADVGARAVNLSFAGDAPSRLERLALTYALYHGCVPVCSSGNSGFDEPRLPLYPASYAADGLAISVGASDSFDKRTAFSSYPIGLDLVAPGLNVYTTYMTYPSFSGQSYAGYVPASGTSFSSPFVTGAVGLLAAARGDLIDSDYQHVIRESADDLSPPGVDEQTGYGRLNLERMLQRVGSNVGVWHDEVAADWFSTEGQGWLSVGETGPGTMGLHFGSHWSTRLAAYATVTIPDSFLTVTGVWPRVAGTLAARGDFLMPYFAPHAEIVSQSATSVRFRGYVYKVATDTCDVCDDRYVPLAPSNVRFGFTVMGTVDRPPVVAITDPEPNALAGSGDQVLVNWHASDPDQVTRVRVTFVPDTGGSIALGETAGSASGGGFTLPCLGASDTPGRIVVTAYDEHGHADQASTSIPFTVVGSVCSAPLTAFRVSPTPFTTALSVFAPGTGALRVLDASGRAVRRLTSNSGVAHWDGRDDHGNTTPAGIYWVRLESAAGTVTKRVVKLAR